MRSLIPTGAQSFTGTLTGGNGRDPISGQEFYYELNLPSGAPELNATVTNDDNPNNPFGAYLISPSGQAVAYATNMVPSASSSTGQVNVQGAQLHALNPAAGTWTVIIVFSPTVSGTALSEPFTVATNQQPVAATAPGTARLQRDQARRRQARDRAGERQEHRDRAGVVLPRCATGGEPDAQPRRDRTVPDTTEPLTFDDNLPVYLVPTDSTALNEQASTDGTQPIQFDSQTASGDPDIASTVGTTATASFAASPVAQGAWDIAPVEAGPFGADRRTDREREHGGERDHEPVRFRRSAHRPETWRPTARIRPPA